MTATTAPNPTNQLRAARHDALLTQEDLGRLVGVTPVCISLIESGRRAGRWRTRKKIARALGVPEHDLFGTDAPQHAA